MWPHYLMWRQNSGVNNFIPKCLDRHLLCPIRSHGWDPSGCFLVSVLTTRTVSEGSFLFFQLSLRASGRSLKVACVSHMSCFPAKSIRSCFHCMFHFRGGYYKQTEGFDPLAKHAAVIKDFCCLLICWSQSLRFRKNVHVFSHHSDCSPNVWKCESSLEFES